METLLLKLLVSAFCALMGVLPFVTVNHALRNCFFSRRQPPLPPILFTLLSPHVPNSPRQPRYKYKKLHPALAPRTAAPCYHPSVTENIPTTKHDEDTKALFKKVHGARPSLGRLHSKAVSFCSGACLGV